MRNDLKKYSEQLRQIVERYYYRQITLQDYRAQRKIVFDCIEREWIGSGNDERQQSDDASE